MAHSRRGRRAPWAMVGVLLLGALLRLAAFDETMIVEDQAAILDVAFQVAHLRYFPFVGMKSSVGVMQTGIIPLLAALPLFAVKRIIAVQWFFSALDLLALAWLARAVRKTWGQGAALVTALLYATAPWVILYARMIWYQSLVAPLATVACAGLLVLVSGRGRRAAGVLALTMVAATLMSMVHLAAAPWGAVVLGLCLLLAGRRRLWRGVWAGLAISGLLVLPYGVYLLRSNFGDLRMMVAAAGGNGGAGAGLNTAAFRLAGELISGANIIANAHGDRWDRAVIEWRTGPVLVLALLGGAVIWAVVAAVRQPRRRAPLALLLGWSLAVPALFLGSDVHLQHFYLLGLFPAPFVLLGAWVAGGTGRGAVTLLRRLGALLLVVVALWWSSLWLVRIELEAAGELERPTRGWLMDRTAATVADYLAREPAGQVIVLSAYEGETSRFDWLRGATQSDRVRVVPAGQGFLIPEGPTCYLVGPQVSADVLWPVAGAVAEQPAMAVPAAPPWRFYCGAPRSAPAAPLAAWENGLSLRAADVSGALVPEGVVELIYTWYHAGTGAGDYHFFTHLMNGDTLVAQADGAGVPHWHWRAGDLILTYFRMDLPAALPPGPYRLRVGMYTWPQVERVPLVSGEDGHTLVRDLQRGQEVDRP